MFARLAPTLAALALLLAACGGGEGDGSDGAPRSGDGAAATTTADGAGGDGGDGGSADPDCRDLDGEPGVIRTFCTGTGVATFAIGDLEGEIGGGECQTGGGYLAFNAGVVTTPDFLTFARPDYAGFSLPEAEGDFSGDGIAATITYEGEAVTILDVTGTHDGDGGTLEGTSASDGTPVSVTFTCS